MTCGDFRVNVGIPNILVPNFRFFFRCFIQLLSCLKQKADAACFLKSRLEIDSDVSEMICVNFEKMVGIPPIWRFSRG